MNLIGFVRDAFIQFIIFSFTGCSFIGTCLVQGSESISHVLVDSVDACYQVIINLLNHLVLGCICADAGSRFIIQALSQCGHIFADFLIRFHDTGILYRCISLAHIIIPGFLQYIVLNGSNAVIQGLIAGFPGGFLGINSCLAVSNIFYKPTGAVAYRGLEIIHIFLKTAVTVTNS